MLRLLSLRIILPGLIAALAITRVYSSPFIVRDIRVEGLQRVSAGTVFSYLPIKVGDRVDVANASAAISDVYKSNLFARVNLMQDGDVLVVQVSEYPVISAINFEGNSTLKSSVIREAFSNANFTEGQIYNPAILQEMVDQLYVQYESMSKFQVKIEPVIETLPRGRVAITFRISEGRTAQVSDIRFVGNRVYSNERLLKLLDTSTTNWFSAISRDDQVNLARFQDDFDRLESFYKDRGFMEFRINSVQTELSSDKTHAFITINVDEGQTYTITGYDFSGNLIVEKKELDDLVAFKPNELYNRSLIRQTTDAISERLADEGYARTQVNIVPEIDELTRKVFIHLVVTPGNRYTVRRVEFTGNSKTYDSVLRRELRQQEGALYSASNLSRSEERIQRLPQIDTLEKNIYPVPDNPDQIDIVYKIKERKTSYIQGGVGYGQSSGALFSFEYADQNLFGSGNRLSVNLTRGSHQQTYGISYIDPYFTRSGISARYDFDYEKYKFKKTELSDWTSNNLSFITTFGFPISEYEKIYLGGGYRRINILLGDEVADEIREEIDKDGKNHRKGKYNEFVLKGSWSQDTTDNFYLPRKGSYNGLSAEVTTPGSDAKYYQLSYQGTVYFPLGKSDDSWIFSIHGAVDYGSDYQKGKGLPFYRRFYAGGIDTLRGYRYASVGPRYKNDSFAGGDLRVVGRTELMVPFSLNDRNNNFRVGAFLDAGNVWEKPSEFDIHDLRYSTGISVQWLSPVGPLNLSYGVPIHRKKSDKRESFQFTIGTTFR